MIASETKRIVGILQEFTSDFFVTKDAEIISVVFQTQHGEDIKKILESNDYCFFGWENVDVGITFCTFFKNKEPQNSL